MPTLEKRKNITSVILKYLGGLFIPIILGYYIINVFLANRILVEKTVSTLQQVDTLTKSDQYSEAFKLCTQIEETELERFNEKFWIAELNHYKGLCLMMMNKYDEEGLLTASHCLNRAKFYYNYETNKHGYHGAMINLINVYNLSATFGNYKNKILEAKKLCEEIELFFNNDTKDNLRAHFFIAYGLTLNNYANIGDKGPSLEKAFVMLSQARSDFKEQNDEEGYAMCCVNLGGTCLSQSTYLLNPIQIVLAIDFYKEALNYFTYETNQYEYAKIKLNLGASYSQLSNLDTNQLNNAIANYSEALEIYRQHKDTILYTSTLSNIARVYRGKAKISNRVGNLKISIDSINKAIEYSNSSKFRMIQSGYFQFLSELYRVLSEEENTISNLNNSIFFGRIALRSFTFLSYPQEFSMNSKTIGRCYLELYARIGDIKYLDSALSTLELAVKYVDPKLSLDNYVESKIFLGNTYLLLYRIKKEESILDKAIEVVNSCINYNQFLLPSIWANNLLGECYTDKYKITKNLVFKEKALYHFKFIINNLTTNTILIRKLKKSIQELEN